MTADFRTFRTPDEWCALTGIQIMDPDGWDRKNYEEDWAIPLTRDEFLGKAFLSTCGRWPNPLLDESKTTWLKLAPPLDDDPPPLFLKAAKEILDIPEFVGLLEAAKASFAMYSAFVEAGFNPAQALQLVAEAVKPRA